jgi:tellurite resistance protein TerB
MSFFDQLKSKANELKNDVLKFKNKDFLNAAMAGSALIAMADGSITSEEKQKMLKFIEHNDALSVFSSKDVITAFQDFVGQIEFDKDIGDAAAYKAIAKMKSDNEAARLLIRMIIAIGSSDGNFDVDEKKIAGKIARELGLNPAEFELL